MLNTKHIAIIGAGPAGLMAAHVLAEAGCQVTIYDRMPSPGRKFLMAGRGGLNLTHSEPLDDFVTRYGAAGKWLTPYITSFSPEDLRAWCEKLGIKTFVGSSGRIFPSEFKASPLLRAWLKYLGQLGVTFEFNKNWVGWNTAGDLVFEDTSKETVSIRPDATLIALGGASWPRLGSDGAWVGTLTQNNISVSPLRPANCGFTVNWSEHFRHHFAGQPIKSLRVTFGDQVLRGEAMVTEKGIEGGVIYALSSALRDAIAAHKVATLTLDLRPDLSRDQLEQKLRAPQGRQSNSTFLRKAAGLSPIAISLLYEILHRKGSAEMPVASLAPLIKAVPLTLNAPFAIDRAISSAGGIKRDALNDDLMLVQKPGVFAAGEMLDWEAPTGGYLLQATFSTAVTAAQGMLRWVQK